MSRIRNRVIVRVLRELGLVEDEGQQLKPHDVTTHFGVSEKTAKRDIAALKARGLIEFVGAPKTGVYRLTKQG